MISLSVGSLLDDNIWHDVLISRNFKEIFFSVDRVSITGVVKGEFSTLNLNNAVRETNMHCRFVFAIINSS